MNTPTIVFARGHYIDGHLTHYPGEEVPPGMIPAEQIAQRLDAGELCELDPAMRPSLYRLFHRFTGCNEREQLTEEQTENYTLQT